MARIPGALGLLSLLAAWPSGGCLAGMISIDITQPPYNADTTGVQNASPAFQLAINNLKGAGGGYLYIPDGAYRFNSLVSLNTDAIPKICIEGQSRDGVKLRSYNSSGVFSFVFTTQSQARRMTVKNLTFHACQANAGTAFKMAIPRGGSVTKNVLIMQDVSIGRGNGSGYFDTGVAAQGVYFPVFKSCSFMGQIGTDWTDASPKFHATCGFDASGAYDPVFMECSVNNAVCGYNLVCDDAQGPESGGFRGCTAVNVRRGITYLQTTNAEPGLWIDACEFTARDYGILLQGRRHFMIAESAFRQGHSGWPFFGIYMITCHQGQLLWNTFTGNLLYPGKSIYINSGAVDLILAHNDIAGANPSAAIFVPWDSLDVYQWGNY